MHIFLSGYPGVGKSTLIRKSLKELNIIPSGFITFSCPVNQDRVSEVFIGFASEMKHQPDYAPALIGRRYMDGFWQAYPDTFNNLGVEILNQAVPPLILMDELGFMEKDAYLFQEKAFNLLNGDIPILGVIKPKPLPFLDRIRIHPQVHIMDITTQNRDQKFAELVKLLRGQLY